MANKVEIVINADGSRAIKAMQDIGASSRKAGEENAQAARAMAVAAKLAGDTVSQQSIKIIQARQRENAAAADYAKLQTAVRKGTLDETVGVTALAGAYQRLTAAKLATATATNVAESHTYASLRETIGGLRIGEILPETLGAAAGIAAMAEAASKLKEAVGDTLDFAEAIQRAREKTGLSVETLSTLHYAAGVTGGDFDAMTSAVARMDREIGLATEGNKTAAAFMKSLGLNAKQLADSPEGASVAFQKFAVTLANTQNPIRRVELATALLGRAGAEQIPTLIQLGENWQKYADGAERTGTMLNGTTLRGLVATNDQIKEMHQKVLGVEIGLTEGLTPALDQMLGVLAGGKTPMDSLNEIGKDLGKTFAVLAETLLVAASTAEIFFSAAEGGKLSKIGARDWAASDQLMAEAKQMHAIAFPGAAGGTGPGDTIPDAMRSAPKQHGPGAGGTDGAFGGVGDLTGSAHERAEKQFGAMRDALEQQKLLHGASLSDEEAYWEKMLASAKKGSDLYKLIVPEVVKAQSAIMSQFVRDSIQDAETAKRFSDEISASLLKTWSDLNKTDAETAKAQYAAATATLAGAGDKRLADLTGVDQAREFSLRMAPAGDAYREIAGMHTQEYDTRRGNLNEQLTRASGAPGDTPEEIAARARNVEEIQKEIDALGRERTLQAAEDEARIRSTTLMGGMNDALAEFVRSTTDAGAALKSWFGGALNTTNDAILKTLTEHNTAGQHIFGQAGKEIFTSAAGSLLKGAEGNLLKGLGIGGKADGASESTALWVRMTGGHLTGGSPASKAIGGWLGLPGTTDGAATIGGDDTSAVGAGVFGGNGALGGILGGLIGKLFHPGGSNGGGDMVSSDIAEALGQKGSGTLISTIGGGIVSGAGKALGFIADLLGHIPGFAGGVDDFGGGWAMVGEQGPELVNLPRGASVTPNSRIGGMGGSISTTVHVDARGATDPAQVEAAGYRGAMRAAPQIHAAVLGSIRDANTRVPSNRKPY